MARSLINAIACAFSFDRSNDMNTIFPSRFLKFALITDAVVSGAVAALQLFGAGWLSELLMLPKVLLFETGVFLVGYTILLVLLARSTALWSLIIGVVVIGNIGWAMACVGLLTSGAVSPNVLGVTFVIVQAVAVLVFAAMEYSGLKASQSAGAPSSVGAH
jgi:hypothetical protein